jgi:signal transduction histidine kinase
LKRRSVFLFFVLPFLGVFAFFALATVLQHRDLKVRTEALVRGQLAATARILGQAASRFLDEGMSPETVLDTILADEEIYFVALLDSRSRVVAWNSRFEGYLPISLSGTEAGQSAIIESPAGKIFSETAGLTTADGRSFRLYLGYALTGMEDMISMSSRTSFLLSGLVLLLGALFFRALYRVQSRYLVKAREAEAERKEKEHFREISAFTAGVTHEIKNPLNSLALVLELLGRKAAPDTRGEVNLGKAQVQTIARIVDRFSRVVKVVHPDLGPLTLDAIVRQAADNLAAEVPGVKTRLRLEVPPGLGVSADPELLAQAFFNILKNAVEASEGTEVRVSARRIGGRIEALVRDDGPGFAPGAAERVFEPFYSTKGKGMGIGLYLAKKIVEAHGGTIEARDPAGRGAEFRIELPGG